MKTSSSGVSNKRNIQQLIKYGCFAFCYYVEIVIKSLQAGQLDSTNFLNLACFVVALTAESMQRATYCSRQNGRKNKINHLTVQSLSVNNCILFSFCSAKRAMESKRRREDIAGSSTREMAAVKPTDVVGTANDALQIETQKGMHISTRIHAQILPLDFSLIYFRVVYTYLSVLSIGWLPEVPLVVIIRQRYLHSVKMYILLTSGESDSKDQRPNNANPPALSGLIYLITCDQAFFSLWLCHKDPRHLKCHIYIFFSSQPYSFPSRGQHLLLEQKETFT